MIEPGSSRPAADEIEIVVANSLDALAPAVAALTAFCAARAVGPEATNRLEVIFEELASNAIRHGFTAGSGQSVHVRATARPNRVDLVFEDDGPQFNPLQLAAPAPSGTIEEAKEGGLGVALVLSLVAGVRYEAPAVRRHGDGFQPRNRMFVMVSTRR